MDILENLYKAFSYHSEVPFIQFHSVPEGFAALTANDHDADGEDLLWVGVWRDVTKSHTRQAAQGEVKGGDVLVFNRRAGGRVAVVVRLAQLFGQVVQPAGLSVRSLHEADGIPDAGKPVGNEYKGAHEQEEDGSPVLRISVQFSCHTDQSQQPSCF